MVEFNIEEESKKLKSIVGQYETDLFLCDIAVLLSLIDTPRIAYYPFQGLDSPLRQLTYLASLNVNSDPNEVTKKEVATDDEWREIVVQTIKSKAGYYDLLLPKDGEDEYEFFKYYQVAMPVFMNYFDTGALNFEEQEIERIQRLFTPFDKEIELAFGLTTSDFLAIYELIDNALFVNLNVPFQLVRNDKECREFSDLQKANKAHPAEWKYEGSNENVKKFVKHFQDRGERFKVSKESFYNSYPESKVNSFFNLLSVIKAKTNYLFYTQANSILKQPLYQLKDGRHLVIEIKQILHSVYSLLHSFATNEKNGITERYYRLRGQYLQEKTCEIFDRFFKGEAHIHNEYTTAPNGDGQDILILNKGLCLIIESKSGREAEPHKVPNDTLKVFEGIYRYFKRNIQEGYDQTFRIKKLFDQQVDFDIYDKNNVVKHHVRTHKYHDVFSIVVTMDKFRKPQIDLSLLLQLDKDDDRYPFSVSIDDLEIILLTMRKLKLGKADFIKFLKYREQLQGRLDCTDELELWGAFINTKKFSIPTEPKMHFRTYPEMAEFYDELYKTGLGFKNEKNLDKKKSNNWIFVEPGRIARNRLRQTETEQ